jgi:hypothetical protein
MTRFVLSLVFLAACAVGFGLILYAVLSGSHRKHESIERESVPVGFSDSSSVPGAGILDSDTGHEGLKHREKEPFDPDKHKPEPI